MQLSLGRQLVEERGGGSERRHGDYVALAQGMGGRGIPAFYSVLLKGMEGSGQSVCLCVCKSQTQIDCHLVGRLSK